MTESYHTSEGEVNLDPVNIEPKLDTLVPKEQNSSRIMPEKEQVVKASEQSQNIVDYGEYADGGNGIPQEDEDCDFPETPAGDGYMDEDDDENGLTRYGKDKNIWVCRKDGSKIPVKIDGVNASSTDSTTWYPLGMAEQAVGRNGIVGLGIVFEPSTKLVGVDFDHCLGKGGLKDSHIADFLMESDTYTEISPSGSGLHLFFETDAFFAIASGDKKVAAHDGFPDVEVYSEGRYFTVTKNVMGANRTVRKVTVEQLNALLALVGHKGGARGVPTAPTAKVGKASGIKWGDIPMATKEGFDSIIEGRAGIGFLPALKPYVEARKTGTFPFTGGCHNGMLAASNAVMREIGNPASGVDYKDKLIAVYRAMKYAHSTFKMVRADGTVGLNNPIEFDSMYESAYSLRSPDWEAERLAFVAKGGVERTGVYGLPVPTITIGSPMKEEPKADYVRVEGVEAPKMAVTTTNTAGVDYVPSTKTYRIEFSDSPAYAERMPTSVKVFEDEVLVAWSGDKVDIASHRDKVAFGRTMESLCGAGTNIITKQLFMQSSEYMESTKPTPSFKDGSTFDINKVMETDPWMVTGMLLASEQITFGGGGLGKSTLACGYCYSVISGVPLFGETTNPSDPFSVGVPTTKGLAMYVDFENPKEVSYDNICSRFYKIGIGHGHTHDEVMENLKGLIVVSVKGSSMEEALEVIRTARNGREMKLTVVDSIMRSLGGGDAKESKDADKFNMLVARIEGVKLSIGHTTKASKDSEEPVLYGGTSFLDNTRCAQNVKGVGYKRMSYVDDNGDAAQKLMVKLEVVKLNDACFPEPLFVEVRMEKNKTVYALKDEAYVESTKKDAEKSKEVHIGTTLDESHFVSLDGIGPSEEAGVNEAREKEAETKSLEMAKRIYEGAPFDVPLSKKQSADIVGIELDGHGKGGKTFDRAIKIVMDSDAFKVHLEGRNWKKVAVISEETLPPPPTV